MNDKLRSIVEWIADENNVEMLDRCSNYCRFCFADLRTYTDEDHYEDCVYLRAKEILREEDNK